MGQMYSLLEVSRALGEDLNSLLALLSARGIQTAGGKLSERDFSRLKLSVEKKDGKSEGTQELAHARARKTPEKAVQETAYSSDKDVSTSPSTSTPAPEYQSENGGGKRPDQKKGRRHNPSEVRNFTNFSELDTLVELLEESGEDVSSFPKSYPFGSLKFLLKHKIAEKYFPGSSLEGVVGTIFPFESAEYGGEIHDNVWLVKGADFYRTLSDVQRRSLLETSKNSEDDLDFAYRIRDIDSDIAVSASLFLMAVESDRFVPSETLERFKWLANGLLLYKGMDEELKQQIYSTYKQVHGRSTEFAHWLFSKEIFERMQSSTEKKVRDDNSYLAAVLFSLKENDEEFELSLGAQQVLERKYAGLRRMQEFMEKGEPVGEPFRIALRRIASDIESAKGKSHEPDVDKFIFNTIKNGTYDYFYQNYCGRGIQFSTFVDYAAAAFFLESDLTNLDSPEFEKFVEYGSFLSRAAKERKVEKIDRLRGKNGKTTLVDLCQSHSSATDAHKELSENWDKYSKVLMEEGCWLGAPRKRPFNHTEVKGMYEFVENYPELFTGSSDTIRERQESHSSRGRDVPHWKSA